MRISRKMLNRIVEDIKAQKRFLKDDKFTLYINSKDDCKKYVSYNNKTIYFKTNKEMFRFLSGKFWNLQAEVNKKKKEMYGWII